MPNFGYRVTSLVAQSGCNNFLAQQLIQVLAQPRFDRVQLRDFLIDPIPYQHELYVNVTTFHRQHRH